jgi:serine/threonine-protein kinase PknK
VVVAEDDVLLREGLVSLLGQAGFEVVGQAGDGPELLASVRATTPELVVTDIRMPPTNSSEGLDAARLIRAELPDTAILVLSAHVDVDQAMELLGSRHPAARRQGGVSGGPRAGVRAGVGRPTL